MRQNTRQVDNGTNNWPRHADEQTQQVGGSRATRLGVTNTTEHAYMAWAGSPGLEPPEMGIQHRQTRGVSGVLHLSRVIAR